LEIEKKKKLDELQKSPDDYKSRVIVKGNVGFDVEGGQKRRREEVRKER